MTDVKELSINNTTYDIKAKSVVDQNSGSVKIWTGTRTQYDAIATKDSNTLYNIVDDADATIPLLELLFPVGAVYFGTMSVCPLQTLGVGTWQALPQDKVIQIAGTRGSVGSTVNESLPNIKTRVWDAYGYGTTSAGTSEGITISDVNNTTGAIGGSGGHYCRYNLDASSANSTYQDNAPVQQDAYLLNGWRRIS